MDAVEGHTEVEHEEEMGGGRFGIGRCQVKAGALAKARPEPPAEANGSRGSR